MDHKTADGPEKGKRQDNGQGPSKGTPGKDNPQDTGERDPEEEGSAGKTQR
jgi:hypothetical protein